MVLSLLRFSVLAVILIGVYGCTTNLSSSNADYVEVNSLDVEHGAAPERMTQAQLREEVERFAFRYAGRLEPYLEAIANETNTPEQRLAIHQWKKEFHYSLVRIANSGDPEIALLDMLVLVTLIRIESEEHLVPEEFFGNNGQAWLLAVRQSEAEIWSIAEEVLDPKQLAAVHQLVQDWHRQNPEVKDLRTLRFSDFAAEVDGVEPLIQPGGLLPEVSEATQAVDEFRRTSERAMFLALVSPALARFEAENFVYHLATQPEFKEYRTLLKQLTETSAKLATVSDQLPVWVSVERQAAVDQAMDHLFDERDKLFSEIDEKSVQFTNLLSQIQETLEIGNSLTGHLTTTMTTFDSLVTRLGIDQPDSQKGSFRIEDYRDTLVEAAVTAEEINKILLSLSRFLDADLGEQTVSSADAALQLLDQHIERWILWVFAALAVLILFSAIVIVGALLIYRWNLTRIDSTR